MNRAAIRYPYLKPPATGTLSTVAPGIEWLRMPLPFALDHVNLWLLADGAAYTAVDTGINLDPVKTAWQAVLAARPLSRLLVTHFHPDHLGLAAWLQERTGAPLWITQGEYLTGQMMKHQVSSYGVPAMCEFFRRHGLDAARVQALTDRGNAYGRGVPAIPATFHPLREGEDVMIGGHVWQVIIGHGHSAEHASFYCGELRVLISGDMLLPRISTNISVFSSVPESDSLDSFLTSLDRLRALPEDTLVLPSHGLPFRGLHRRIEQLHAHHADRCAALAQACATPQTAASLIPVLFPREITDTHQTMFAMGEAIAHLNYLQQAGRLTRKEENGILHYICR
ncbi:MAG: MBL fold metallo-hydrolase [Zoogloeaceae bacterium]|jgi:glyoxylase-like metal-dependent hydrolase (beta-lactamase superfamily II)|nr:MBL fold metallo-hydrolase [Zoogloeaceae bacterium]